MLVVSSLYANAHVLARCAIWRYGVAMLLEFPPQEACSYSNLSAQEYFPLMRRYLHYHVWVNLLLLVVLRALYVCFRWQLWHMWVTYHAPPRSGCKMQPRSEICWLMMINRKAIHLHCACGFCAMAHRPELLPPMQTDPCLSGMWRLHMRESSIVPFFTIQVAFGISNASRRKPKMTHLVYRRPSQSSSLPIHRRI